MACHKRTIEGNCNHHQCQFSKETHHNYECVELINYMNTSFCEIGENCLTKCPYSWIKGSKCKNEIIFERWVLNEQNENNSYLFGEDNI